MCASSGRRSKPIPSARNSSSRKPGSATGCAPRIKSPTAVPDEISMLLTMRSAGATMKIADLLSPTDVMIDVRASNKRLLLQEFAAKAAAGLGLPVETIASCLLKREDLGSTGIGHGVAIPHA